jgi:iron complex outermembrane receptor protein
VAAPISLDEVVVTAQRRSERAQDVPISITAFSPERLEQQNITQAQDLQGNIPSLVLGANGQGSRDSQSPTLRGQGATFQASPGVVMYLNEVPLPAAITLSQQGGPGNFVDLENLQVLAGPQGTLFGRNTTGGAILLVPKKPTNNFSGWAQATFGNYSNQEYEAGVNIPIVDDKLLVRAVAAFQDRDGYTDDVLWNKSRDDKHWYSGRLGVTFRPNERLDNYLMLYGANSRNNGTGHIAKGFNIDGPFGLAEVGLCSNTPIAVSGDFSCDVYRAAIAEADALGPRRTAHGVDDFQRTETWGLHDTLSYEINANLTLRNIVSYQRFKSFYSYDVDATVIQQNEAGIYQYPSPGQATLPGAGTPLVFNNTTPLVTPFDHYRQFTEELQLQGSFLDKKLIVTAGAFYFDQTPVGAQGGTGITYCPAGLTGTPIPGVPPACIANITYGRVATESKALYGQGTFDFGALTPALDSLRLTAGVRYTWDRVKGDAELYTPTGLGDFICTTSALVTTDVRDCGFSAELKSGAATWTVGLDYKPIRDLMVYGKVSRGYKAGGFNANAVFVETRTFEPEEVTAYEVGLKSDLRLGGMPSRINVNYYFLDYKNIQRAAGDFNPVTQVSGARINAAEAQVQGVELEASFRPLRWVEVGGNLSWTDFEYTRYSLPSNGFLPDCSGEILPAGAPNDLTCLKGQYVVPYMYNVHLAVDLPVPEEVGAVSLFVNYAHSAAQHTEGTVVPPNQPGEKLESFGLLNISLDWRDVYQSGFDVGLFVTNATDELYRISNSDVHQGGVLLNWSTIYGEPRMYGVRLKYRFGGE